MTATKKTILFVCAQGAIRSRTAEVLAIRAGLDARSCGTDSDAIVPLSDALIRISDCIVCMEEHHAAMVREYTHAEGKPIHVLNIEDIYEPFSPRLVAALVAQLDALLPDLARALSAGN